jgi:hypothetical protein
VRSRFPAFHASWLLENVLPGFRWLLPRLVPASLLAAVIGLALVAPGQALVAHAQPSVAVTVQEVIKGDHRLTVTAGTEVLWRDPHFERVWFPQGAGAPRVERAEIGFRAVFAKPGTYRGRFTIVGGHRSDDVYPMIVTVTER